MNSAHRVERGLVIRTTPYKEADLMVTLLTECSGKISVIARGARRKGSRLMASLQPVAFSEFTLYESRGNFSIDEAEPIELFKNLREDLQGIMLGTYFGEAAGLAAEAEAVDPYILRLTLNALYAMDKKLADFTLIKSAFELKLACLAGYQPDIFICASCDKPLAEGRFDILNAAIYCDCCNGTGVKLDSGTLSAMRYVIGADIKRTFSFKLGDSGIKTMSKVTELYLKQHFGCDFKSLNLYHSMFGE